jgi:mRNA-degrading endonuclease RelE of RelBE toxin-antitoxin system
MYIVWYGDTIIDMARLDLNIDDKLITQFRDAYKTMDMNLTTALEEVITFWLRVKLNELWPEEEQALKDIKTGKTEMVTQTREEFLDELKGLENEPWEMGFEKPKDFKKQVLNIPQSIRPKLTQVMTDLSYNPNILGNKKRTKYGECYTIRISDSHRHAYAAKHATHKIEIYRVGDHKDVYGKDWVW